MSPPLLSRSSGALALFLQLSALSAAWPAESLEAPVRIRVGNDPIDVDIGHAAPYLHDFDGDGVRDLLVGQFGEGKLRLYRNGGTNARPRYEAHKWFQAGGKDGTVPTG